MYIFRLDPVARGSEVAGRHFKGAVRLESGRCDPCVSVMGGWGWGVEGGHESNLKRDLTAAVGGSRVEHEPKTSMSSFLSHQLLFGKSCIRHSFTVAPCGPVR